MLYAAIALGGFLAIYFLRIFRHTLYKLAEQSVGLLNDLLTAEEDHIKLERLQSSTQNLVITLLAAIVLIVAAGVILILPSGVFSLVIHGEFNTTGMDSWQGILALSVGASIPFFIPGMKTPSGYTELSVLLHRIVLDNYILGLRLLKREEHYTYKKGIQPKETFVIISGLARAGTTSLMNKLVETSQFASLNYANMPFLLSPNTWARIYKPKDAGTKERSHKDGVQIGLDSTEALEEYFFKAEMDDAYIHENGLYAHEVSNAHYRAYLNYQAVVRNGEHTYLAKNNNFMLRYKGMRAFNDQFLFVVMYRHPLYHAASLLEKHQQYSKMQQEDTFVLDYMNWLGHHEFGLNQKPFVFEKDHVVEGDKSTLDYWLEIWINYYAYAEQLATHARLQFVNYDDYCAKPNEIIKVLLSELGIAFDSQQDRPYTNTRAVEYLYTEELLDEALIIFEKLKR